MGCSIFRLVERLDRAGISYLLSRTRPDSIRVTATPVGERIEVDCFEDAHVEFSRFSGDESVGNDPDALAAILHRDARP